MADKLVTIGEANSLLNDYSVSIPGASNKCATIKELNDALAGISTSVYDKFTFPSDDIQCDMSGIVLVNVTNKTIQGKRNNSTSFSIVSGEYKQFTNTSDTIKLLNVTKTLIISIIDMSPYTITFNGNITMNEGINIIMVAE
jgi:hypothetical protein